MKRGAPAKKWLPPGEFYVDELCTRCGICCGSTDGHPCEHLRMNEQGKSECAVYDRRLGPHRTVDGHNFICVQIRHVIEEYGGYRDCGYVREIRRIRKLMGQDDSDLGPREKP